MTETIKLPDYYEPDWKMQGTGRWKSLKNCCSLSVL